MLRLISSAFGAIVYALIIIPIFVKGGYLESMSIHVSLNADGIKDVLKNIINYIYTIKILVSGIYLYIFALLFILCIIAIAIRLKILERDHYVALIISFLGFLMSILMFMTYKNAATYPRVMIGIGGVFSAIFYSIHLKKIFTESILCIFICYFFNKSLLLVIGR